MIKKLRKRFIAITMLSVVLVFTIIIGSINIAAYRNEMSRADAKLNALAEGGGTFERFLPEEGGDRFPNRQAGGTTEGSISDSTTEGAVSASTIQAKDSGEVPPPLNEERPGVGRGALFPFFFLGKDRGAGINAETPFNTRYFTVTFDDRSEVSSVNTDNIAAVSAEEAKALARELLQSRKSRGFSGNYKYTATDVDDGTMYIFLDCGQELSSFRAFLQISIAVSLLGSALIFILVFFLSKIVVKPMAESYEKQKRFITDASHEIKTRLAIIEANTEVIELESGESQWTESTRNQITRLTALTEKLVFLSRMEEEGSHLELSDFNLSEAVEETAESFLGVAEANEKLLQIEVTPEITYHGDEGMLRQMVSLLTDNALKYSNDNGQIKVTLNKHGKHPVLTVWNTAEGIEKGNLNILFERFYRKDGSRSTRTGGHGIGLSVVQAIVNAHKGKITAESTDGQSVTFTAVL